MSVLIINSSLKGRYSKTLEYSKIFAAALSQDDKIYTLDLAEMNINPCKESCISKCMNINTGGKCVQDDGFNDIIDLYSSVDYVIWSCQKYNGIGISSVLKNFIERLAPIYSYNLSKIDDKYYFTPFKDLSSQKHFIFVKSELGDYQFYSPEKILLSLKDFIITQGSQCVDGLCFSHFKCDDFTINLELYKSAKKFMDGKNNIFENLNKFKCSLDEEINIFNKIKNNNFV